MKTSRLVFNFYYPCQRATFSEVNEKQLRRELSYCSSVGGKRCGLRPDQAIHPSRPRHKAPPDDRSKKAYSMRGGGDTPANHGAITLSRAAGRIEKDLASAP